MRAVPVATVGRHGAESQVKPRDKIWTACLLTKREPRRISGSEHDCRSVHCNAALESDPPLNAELKPEQRFYGEHSEALATFICLSAIFMVSACADESMSSVSLWPQIQNEVGAPTCDGPQQCKTDRDRRQCLWWA